ncbi:MAG: hypothetical protein AAGI23_18110 [Bacteroidota bacterium]
MINKHILILLTVFVLPFVLRSQDNDLESGSVEVIRSFDARLLDSEKINLAPSLPEVDTTSKRQRYDVPLRTLSIKYPPPRIRPLAIGRDQKEAAYNGYVKAGGGFPNSLFGEAAYRVFIQDQLDLGIDMRHHSANNSQRIENQRFANNEAKIGATYYTPQGVALGTNLGYTQNNVFYYGYNQVEGITIPDSIVEPEDVKQRFSILDFGAEIFNGTRTLADFNYKASFDLYQMGDISPASETGFDLKIMGEKWFQEKFPLRVTLETDFTRYSVTSDSVQRLNNFFLQPNFTYSTDLFKVRAGVNLASSDDVFSLFPDIEISANVIPGLVTLFAGAEGDLTKNNFRTLTDYNPFLQSGVDIRNTRYNRYFIGAKGNVQGISYQGEFNYKGTENLALFLDVVEQGNVVDLYKFRALYDDVNIINIKASVEADIQEFKVAATLSQNFFEMTNEEKAWHLPALEINGSVQYTTLEDKLQLKGELFVQNAVPYINELGETDNLDALFDVNVSAEYYFTDNFGGFLNLYNIANNQRERWFRYPIYGLNALAGVSLRF